MMKSFVRFVLVASLILGMAACGDSPTSNEDPTETYAVITTFVGTGEAGLGAEGLGPLETQLYWPQDLTFGPDGLPYILDWNNHRVRVLDQGVMRTVIGTGELGDSPAGVALEVGLNHPTHISFDPLGRLILSAWHNSKVMRVDFATGLIEPIVGDGTRFYSGDGGPAIDAWVNLPTATAFDAAGRMYISDQENQRVRMVDTNGIITTVVGTGVPGFSGDGGPATEAQIWAPVSQAAAPSSRIAIDSQGNLYLADSNNNRIRKIDTNGIINTVAGNGDVGIGGDGGPATEASLDFPTDIAIDGEGNLYIADTLNSCIRKVDTNGTITTFAGPCGSPGYAGDGGHPTEALLDRPYGIVFDGAGNFYIADTHNHRIRVIRR